MLIDEETLVDFPFEDDIVVVPVGDENESYTYTTTYTAEFDSAVLKIQGMSEGGGDSTLIVDNVFFGIPGEEPLLGDCNLDGLLNADDLSCASDIAERDAVLGALNTLPGDLDGNGDVAFPDFLVLSTNFNQDLPAYTDGNIDLAGPIDLADFLIMSTNFNKTPTAGAIASSVPEPTGFWLILLGLTVTLRLRRKCSVL